MTWNPEHGRDPESGELIPAHFIKEVICEHNGKVVLKGNWGTAVSKNPYLVFQFQRRRRRRHDQDQLGR